MRACLLSLLVAVAAQAQPEPGPKPAEREPIYMTGVAQRANPAAGRVPSYSAELRTTFVLLQADGWLIGDDPGAQQTRFRPLERGRWQAELKNGVKLMAVQIHRQDLTVLDVVIMQGARRVGGVRMYLRPVSKARYDEARRAHATRQLNERVAPLISALDAYQRDRGAYPDGDCAAVIKLLKAPRAKGGPPYLRLPPRVERDGALLDPWGQPIRYARTSDGFSLTSAGPDRTFEDGAGDDIRITHRRGE